MIVHEFNLRPTRLKPVGLFDDSHGRVDLIADGVEEYCWLETKVDTPERQRHEGHDFTSVQIGRKFFMSMMIFWFLEWTEANLTDHDQQIHRGDDHAGAGKDREPRAER